MNKFLSLLVCLGGLLEVGVLGQGSPTYHVKTAADLVQISIPNINNRLTALLTGLATENDGKGGVFFYQAGSAVATNTHSVFKPAGSAGRWLRASLNVSEEDGSPSLIRLHTIKVPNGTLTDNGDGTASIAITGGAATTWDAIGDPAGSGTIAFGNTSQLITSTGDGLTVFELYNTDPALAVHTPLLKLSFNTTGDPQAIYAEFNSDRGGAPVADYTFGQAAFTLAVAVPMIVGGDAGVQISGDGDGAITFTGRGNGSDEDFMLNLDDTSNTIVASSSTGVTVFDLGAIGIDLDSSTLKIPANNDPTVTAAGGTSVDSNNNSLRIFGTEQRVIPTIFTASVTIFDPDGVQAVSDAVPLLPVESTWAPFGITIRDIYLKTDASSTYSIELEEWTSIITPTVTSIEIVATAASAEAEDDGTLTDASIAAGSIVFVDLPATAANFITVTFTYTINAGN